MDTVFLMFSGACFGVSLTNIFYMWQEARLMWKIYNAVNSKLPLEITGEDFTITVKSIDVQPLSNYRTGHPIDILVQITPGDGVYYRDIKAKAIEKVNDLISKIPDFKLIAKITSI